MDGKDPRTDLTALFETRAGAQHPLGNIPLIVISPLGLSLGPEVGFTPEQLLKDHLRLQKDLVRLSRRGKQVLVRDSGHHVQLDAPEVVIRCIREVIRQSHRKRSVGH